MNINIRETMNLKHAVRGIAAIAFITVSVMATSSHAYNLQANTIYAQSGNSIYMIDVDSATATQVADANASLSEIQDLAFDGDNLFGMNLNWQLNVIEMQDSAMQPVKDAESFSLQFQGLEARNGILYGAERNALTIINKASGNTEALCDGCAGYGLGVGELVTDLAFAEDGTLYALIYFSQVQSTYLGVIDLSTGLIDELRGNTDVPGLIALTVREGVIYAMDRSGDLYTLGSANGAAVKVADAVLPGVTGMDTSPMAVGANNAAIGEQGSGSGSLSWLMISLLLLARSLRTGNN